MTFDEPTVRVTDSRLHSLITSAMATVSRDDQSVRRKIFRALTLRLAFFAIGVWMMYTSSLVVQAGGAFLASTQAVSLTASVFHDAIHGNIPVSEKVNALIAFSLAGLLAFSPHWWGTKHVRHHRYVGSPQNDPDIQFGRLLRLNPLQEWYRSHRLQPLTMTVGSALALANMQRPRDIFQLLKRSSSPYMDAARYICGKYGIFIATWLPCVFIKGWAGLTSFVIFEVTAGVLVTAVTQPQHNTQLTGVGYGLPRAEYFETQLLRSSDVESKWGIWRYLSGGTNLHVAHHLCPRLTFVELPATTATLQEALAIHGYSWPTHKHVGAAIASVLRHAVELSRNPS